MAWLAAGGDENDPVHAAGRDSTLAAILTQDGDTVTLTVDVLDLVFRESL